MTARVSARGEAELVEEVARVHVATVLDDLARVVDADVLGGEMSENAANIPDSNAFTASGEVIGSGEYGWR